MAALTAVRSSSIFNPQARRTNRRFVYIARVHVVIDSIFFGAFCGQTTHPAAKVLKGTNRNMPARNTMVQLLAPYIDHESHSAQRHRQTDVTLMTIADRTV